MCPKFVIHYIVESLIEKVIGNNANYKKNGDVQEKRGIPYSMEKCLFTVTEQMSLFFFAIVSPVSYIKDILFFRSDYKKRRG